MSGGADPAPQFPVNSFRDAAIYLRRPFTTQAIKFKVQATWPKDNPTGGLLVTYIDARLVVERLNLVVPHLWHDAYEPAAGDLMWCHLTIDGVTRSDVGQGAGKAQVSDALKRAAVRFGVGVSLYAVPKMILNVSDEHLKPRRTSRGPTLELTPNGQARVREIYAAWLSATGEQSFGRPLDHGDVEDSTGDADADPQLAAEQPALAPAPAAEEARDDLPHDPVELDSQALLDELVAAKSAAGLPDTAEAREWVRAQLRAVGLEDVPERVTLATLRRLKPEQMSSLIDVFNAAAEAREAQSSGAGAVA